MSVLFGPMLVLGLAPPMSIGGALAEGTGTGVVVVLFAAAGAAGLYTAARMALHALDPGRPLPPRASVLLGTGPGRAMSAVGAVQGLAAGPFHTAVFAGPGLGLGHLIWLCRHDLRRGPVMRVARPEPTEAQTP